MNILRFAQPNSNVSRHGEDVSFSWFLRLIMSSERFLWKSRDYLA